MRDHFSILGYKGSAAEHDGVTYSMNGFEVCQLSAVPREQFHESNNILAVNKQIHNHLYSRKFGLNELKAGTIP